MLQGKLLQRDLEYQQLLCEDLRLGEILVKFGYVSQEDVLKCIGEQFDVDVVDLNKVRPEVEAVDAVPRNTARMHNILPLKRTDKSLVVAMDDMDLCTIDNLRFILNMEIKPVLAPGSSLSPHQKRRPRVGQ